MSLRINLRRPLKVMRLDAEFQRKFKSKAANKGLTMQEYSRILAERDLEETNKNETKFNFKW